MIASAGRGDRGGWPGPLNSSENGSKFAHSSQVISMVAIRRAVTTSIVSSGLAARAGFRCNLGFTQQLRRVAGRVGRAILTIDSRNINRGTFARRAVALFD